MYLYTQTVSQSSLFHTLNPLHVYMIWAADGILAFNVTPVTLMANNDADNEMLWLYGDVLH